MKENVAKGLLISVGGTPNPVAYSIEWHRPEKIVFFASRESRNEIETKVRPLTTHRWRDQEVITTGDPQDLTRSMEVLAEKLPECLANLGLSVEDLVADYTGGTKTMSAALVLATIHQPVRYSYVGGTVRTKEGLGVVLDGSEAIVTGPNPWDVLAIELRRRIGRQFNAGHFAEAKETAAEAADKVSDRWRGFYKPLADLCDAYQCWSGFEYGKAERLLRQATARLRLYLDAAQLPALSSFLTAVQQDLDRLAGLLPAFQALQSGQPAAPEAVRALIVDLVAHAVRTARLAGRPDDAVARLYSAIEKLAKADLARRGIDNSAAPVEQVPEPLREEYVRRYADPESGLLRFGLSASYGLLAALGAGVGERYRARDGELAKLLAERNSSLMVHGWKPVRAAVFDGMLDMTLDFLDITVDELPALPAFPAG
jgi:CRISPR-associated protein (TIGR02710 family)